MGIHIPRQNFFTEFLTMTLYTNHGVAFQIDDANYDRVSRHSWHLKIDGHRTSRYIRTKISGEHVALHQFLFGKAPVGMMWDHINRDSMDNRRANLRVVTAAVNARNRTVNRNSRSGVKGVRPVGHRWLASIRGVNGKKGHLGYFATLEEATAARLAAEHHYWGTDS